jgi:hypothetical protein
MERPDQRPDHPARGAIRNDGDRRIIFACWFVDANRRTLVAVVEVWKIFLHVGDPWIYILLATLGGALVLLGPGAWSVDARLFGWKRLEIRPRKSQL